MLGEGIPIEIEKTRSWQSKEKMSLALRSWQSYYPVLYFHLRINDNIPIFTSLTPPKFNIEPENGGFQ